MRQERRAARLPHLALAGSRMPVRKDSGATTWRISSACIREATRSPEFPRDIGACQRPYHLLSRRNRSTAARYRRLPPGRRHPHHPVFHASRRFAIVVVLLGVCGGCASLADTPAQELALSRWTTCHQSVTGAELKRVQPDGRITFWYSGTSAGRSMLECLQQAAKNGPNQPGPMPEARDYGSRRSG